MEPPGPKGWEGHTDNYLRVVLKVKVKRYYGKVLLKKVKDNYIFGQLI